ncbi:hypothetical protein VFPPC_14257 [Pochonia chlamydosporia 170]|uniref:DUF6987 domain-containing protein n=1 Tax=Pochonia chlamydosporia 170 TaxID=1380566 RepID=A0A179FKR8_METCM|nr:hypothetical protein VFPPC_14257 [Pochonia chlamydosporia 170]OAQ65897.1 hypothetical protein VFPPC_14257 [Pochonia chlamydosporia 170]
MPVTNPLSSLSPTGSGPEGGDKQKEGPCSYSYPMSSRPQLDTVPRSLPPTQVMVDASYYFGYSVLITLDLTAFGAVGTDTLESVPRTVAGVVNDKGDIVDKSGKVIGSVTDQKDHEKLVGGTVTEKGDVVSDLGESLANVHIDDNYTPTQVPDKKEGGGGWNVLGKAKTAMQYGDNIRNAVSYGQNLQNKFGGGQKGEAEKAGQDVSDKAGEGIEGAKDTAASQKDNAEKTGQDVTNKAGEAAEGAKESTEQNEIDAPVQMENHDDPTQKDVIADTEGLKSQVDEKKGETEEAATDAKDTAEDTLDKGEKAAGEQDEPMTTQSPKPIPEGDEATKAGEDATKDAKEAGEGVEGKLDEAKPEGGELDQDKLGDEKLDDVKPDESQLPEGEAKDKLDEAKPDEGALDETKDEATGKVEEGAEEAGEAAEKPLDFTILKNTKVNKAGNLVNDKGDIIGRLVEGDPKQLIGKTSDEEGQIWNESGKVVGKAEPISDNERDQAAKDFAPFENFPDAIVEGDGRVMSEGRQVGEVIEGDAKRMKGSRVDEDGDILDRRGNVIGKAKPWDEPEEVPEEATDMTSLAGKRVNKAGNVVDAHGQIFGRVIEGNVKSLVGRMCDKEGNIMSESGEKIGRAELVPESEREGSKDGPFAELSGCTVTKDGKVVTSSGEVVGRLTQGDGKALYGRSVDEDGDVVDKNGNVLGKAERWEEPEVEKKKDPLAGRKVNRDGNVVDEEGNIIGKLVSGDLNICSGKEIDDDGDVINSKGNTIGHVSLLEDIPPEPEESAEDKETREQAEKDRKLAGQLAASIEQSLDKIKPILKMITDKVDKAERTPKEELDEEQLVREVKPLIEEGSKILTETNGVVRGMDPDGRIQRQAKHKSSTKDATPEEHHLAEVLKELTGDVTQTIDNAKRKIEGMPHAKKELNPLWGLLSEPLFQIVAAVGLLLNGVLSLVGRLLSGLGLGGLVDNLLGTLGLNKVLDGLGLGSVTGALTGKKDKKKE